MQTNFNADINSDAQSKLTLKNVGRRCSFFIKVENFHWNKYTRWSLHKTRSREFICICTKRSHLHRSPRPNNKHTHTRDHFPSKLITTNKMTELKQRGQLASFFHIPIIIHYNLISHLNASTLLFYFCRCFYYSERSTWP